MEELESTGGTAGFSPVPPSETQTLHVVPQPDLACTVREDDDGVSLSLAGDRNDSSVRLSEQAHVLWALCDGARTIADIVALLEEAYPDTDSGTIATSVLSILNGLAGYRALSFRPVDLSDSSTAAALFGVEIVNIHRPSAELVWHLERIRQFVLGVMEPFIEPPTSPTTPVELDAAALATAKLQDVDGGHSFGEISFNRYLGLFESRSFQEAVTAVVEELDTIVPHEGQRLEVSGRAYYPAGGRMGWHSNRSVPGLRVYCTWSEAPRKNFFRYEDPRSGDLVTYWEPAGWTLKSFIVPPRPYRLWHCIGADSRRFALGFHGVPN